MFETDRTHDESLTSWIESANDPAGDFPIQNLPLCVFDLDDDEPRIGVRIGGSLLDLQALAGDELFDREDDDPLAFALELESLNMLMALDPADWAYLRGRRVDLLRSGSELESDAGLRDRSVFDATEARLLLPCEIGDYTDFYASLYHATNVGSMFRPDNPLLPNYKWIPIGYHGRASSLVVSGERVRRPVGQLLPGATIDDGAPERGPCKLLDYELEVGAFVGGANAIGEEIGIDRVHEHLFGLCLVNDWSARDMQKWEYQPLGPFLAKSFATSVSPYVVTAAALAPFRCPVMERSGDDPKPLDYLSSGQDQKLGGFDVTLEVSLASAQMRERGLGPVKLSEGSFRDMYWTLGQMLTHHASNGCPMSPGDLIASGTVSGPSRSARGCLLELTWDGEPWADEPKVVPGTQRTPIELPTGEQRKFLADGDEVIIRGWCEREGFRRIGFGECRGVVEPAKG